MRVIVNKSHPDVGVLNIFIYLFIYYYYLLYAGHHEIAGHEIYSPTSFACVVLPTWTTMKDTTIVRRNRVESVE